MTEAEKAAFAWLRTLKVTDYGTMDREGSLTFEKCFLAGAAWQREQVEAGLRKMAKHYLEADGNLSREQKAQAHDTLLVAIGCLKHGLFAAQSSDEGAVSHLKSEKLSCDKPEQTRSECRVCKGRGWYFGIDGAGRDCPTCSAKDDNPAPIEPPPGSVQCTECGYPRDNKSGCSMCWPHWPKQARTQQDSKEKEK
jgi:Zn ribbon nucleic-acid-binding protein